MGGRFWQRPPALFKVDACARRVSKDTGCDGVGAMEWTELAIRALAILSLSLVVLAAIGLIQPS
jgi:hypothetical protein